jgi:flagellar biosynthesis/type III secretory pathway protein FliH
MSSAIRLGRSSFKFVPASHAATSGYEKQENAAENAEAIRQQIRMELEQDYQRRLDAEINRQFSADRERFAKLFSECTARFDSVIQSLRNEIQTQVVDFSIQLSEVILRHELPDSAMIRNLIVKMLEPVSDLQGARVRISSADWVLFGGCIMSEHDRSLRNTVEFVDDPKLVSGDVIIESRNGIFDARLSERLKLLKEALHERSGRKKEQPVAN